MSFPGMTPPGIGGAGGGSNMQGMTEQEQAMVKMVCFVLFCHVC